jgi:hypothetical protein
MAFQAGGIDGSMSYGATYNSSGDTLDDDEVVALETSQQNGGEPVVTLELPDVKPGDYGSITFGLEVENNPAWVASCLNIQEDVDHLNYESEISADDDVNSSNTDGFDAQDTAGEVQSTQSTTPGELAENMYIIPFYTEENPDSGDDPLAATFFDAGYPNYDYNQDGDLTWTITGDDVNPSTVGINAGFWNSREGGNDWGDVLPLAVEDAVRQPISTSTIGWGEGAGDEWNPPFTTEHVAPDAVAQGIGDGCVFVDGAVSDADSESGDDASALQPGDTVYFGYDWHVPFSVGNEVQGDKLVLDFGFTFSQIRHTESAELSNIFAPGQNSPEDTES